MRQAKTMALDAGSFLISPQRGEAPWILTLDIGTSSIRVALFDRLGRALQGLEARRSFEIRLSPDGTSEADAEQILSMVGQCLDQILDHCGSLSSQIAGIASCTLVSNLLGIDKNNRAITPLSTYADTRAASEVEGLKADLSEPQVHERTGCHFHPSYWPARLRWIFRHQPELFRRVKRWISIGEYLELNFFGQAAVSYSVASWTGLLDRFRLIWDPELLDALPIRRDQLSPLTDCTVPRFGLLPGPARRWPALRNLPWFPSIGDGAAANIGSGCTSDRRLAITLGTSSAVRITQEKAITGIPTGLWCYRVDGRRSLLGGALSEGGCVYAWLTRTMDFRPFGDLEKALSEMEPDGHGLTILPFWAGERSPGWRGHARATLHGLSLATTPLHILRAGLEAVAYRIGRVYDLLAPFRSSDTEVIGSGRAILQSPLWAGILADVLGQPIFLSAIEEASARGSALLALEALGILSSLEEAPIFIREIHRPDPIRHDRYRRAMQRQEILYQRLIREDLG